MKRLAGSKNIIAAFILIPLLIQGCFPKTDQKSITRSGFFFDTLINITVYDTDDESILDDCFDMCDHYEKLLSMTVNGSDICRINNSGTEAVPVSSDTLKLIEESYKYFRLSDGMLDITVAPLSELWTKSRAQKVPPSDDDIKELLLHVGFDRIEINSEDMTIRKSSPNTMLDTGALAKGFIADRLRELLIEKGIHSAIISLGGNIVTIGSKPDGADFRIGIKKPFGSQDEISASLNISNMSVVTSGVYERYFEFDNRLYHHILDPRTGYPCDTDLLSATIISSSSLEGDALSTICLLYGLKEAERLINNTPGVEAVFITKDDRLHYSEGAEAYIK